MKNFRIPGQIRILVPLFLIVAILAPVNAWSAMTAYMMIEGANIGVIEGGSTRQNREGAIEVHSFGYNLSIALDPTSGLPAGKRAYRPIRFQKAIDKATPLLFKALTTADVLTVSIDFYKPDLDGREVLYYKILLEDARIVSITPSHSDGVIGAQQGEASTPFYETIGLTFGRITTEIVDGNIIWDDVVVDGRV